MAEERTMKEMHHMPRTEEEKKNLLVRLRRAEGQIRGIEKMVENDVYCPDILIQVSAVQSALNSFNKELLTCHLKGCVAQDVRNGNDASLDELADGAQIAVTNDPSNEARALQLLADAGLIELDANAGLSATQLDITANPKNLKIVEMEAAQLPRALQDVDMAVINGNYAKEAGLSPAENGLYVEAADSECAQTYANILAVAEQNKDADLTKALVAAITSQAVKDYISTTYSDGSVLCIF